MRAIVTCEKCRCQLDPEDLFCPNCGHEAPVPEGEAKPAPSGTLEAYRFDCSGCGASMTWDIEAEGLRCAFCGLETLQRTRRKERVPIPRHVVPFRISRDEAEAIFRKWVGTGFFRPSDAATRSELTRMQAPYLPFYLLSATVETCWTADTDRTTGRASWNPYSGTHTARYENLLVPASGSITLEEVQGIVPFDVSEAVPYTEADLSGHPIERFSVTKRRARHLAKEAVEALEYEACAKELPGTSYRNLKVNVLITGSRSEPCLLPVWILAFRYRNRLYRAVMNGQTGRCTGKAPTSFWKVLLVVAAVLVGILLVLFLIAIAAS